MKTLSFILTIGFLSGCFQFVPVADTVPERGAEVRTDLAQFMDLPAGEVTVRDVRRVDGIVYRATPDSIAVASEWLYNNLGTRYGTNGEVYYFTRDQMRTVEIRKLQPARTVVLVALGVGAGAGVFAFAADNGGDNNPNPGKGPIQTHQTVVIPIPQ